MSLGVFQNLRAPYFERLHGYLRWTAIGMNMCAWLDTCSPGSSERGFANISNRVRIAGVCRIVLELLENLYRNRTASIRAIMVDRIAIHVRSECHGREAGHFIRATSPPQKTFSVTHAGNVRREARRKDNNNKYYHNLCIAR